MLSSETCYHKVTFTIQAEISPITCVQAQRVQTIGSAGEMLDNRAVFLYTHTLDSLAASACVHPVHVAPILLVVDMEQVIWNLVSPAQGLRSPPHRGLVLS